MLNIIKLFVMGLIFACLLACSKGKEVVAVKIIKVNPSVPATCHQLSIPDCQLSNHGEIYNCLLFIQNNSNLCAAQIDALNKWQKGLDK